MPCLKYIVQNAINKELRLLRGKTIECISLIGLAVSREKVLAVLVGNEVRQFLLMALLSSRIVTLYLMENPQDKEGRKTTYTCPHTAEHIYG